MEHLNDAFSQQNNAWQLATTLTNTPPFSHFKMFKSGAFRHNNEVRDAGGGSKLFDPRAETGAMDSSSMEEP